MGKKEKSYISYTAALLSEVDGIDPGRDAVDRIGDGCRETLERLDEARIRL